MDCFARRGWAPEGIFTFSIVLSAAIVLAYIFLGGLASAIYNEVLQFFLIVAGFLPLVLLGLRNVGGWSGLKAAVPAAYMHEWRAWRTRAQTLWAWRLLAWAWGWDLCWHTATGARIFW